MTFIGTGFTLTYLKAAGRGSIDVYIDGTKVNTINAYSATTDWQQTWTSSTLSEGVHTVSLKNAGSGLIDLDAITISGPVSGTQYDDSHTAWTYTGTWTAYTGGGGPYDDTLHYSNVVGVSAQAQFTGTQFTLIFTKHPNRGYIEIWLDGTKIDTLNAYSPTTSWQNLYTKSGLPAGTHTVTVKHAGPSGTYIDVDAIQILDVPVSIPTPGTQTWYSSDYTYSPDAPHAVTEVDRGLVPTDSFHYDLNGNMDCRTESGVTYKQTYNAENRIASIQKLASGTCDTPGPLTDKWDYTYDGDGTRTAQSHTAYTNGTPGTPVFTRYYFGGAYETTGSTWKKYYSFGGQTVAMRESSQPTHFKYFLSDHLGSTSVVLSETGAILEQQRYLPFGEVRTDIAMPPYRITSTDFTYTGQRDLPGTGLMDYKARFYSPALGRFIQPDTLIPSSENPQNWNRFSYVLNNPITHNDPTGHCADGLTTIICFAVGGAIVGGALYAANVISSGQDWNWGDFALAAGTGAVAGVAIAGAAVAVAAGAITATAGAVIAGAGTGLATGGGGYMAANIVTHNKFDSGDFAIASSVGAMTGATGPIVGTTLKGAAILNGVSGAVQYEATYYHHNKKLDYDADVLVAAGLSAASTAISGPYTKPSSLFDDLRPMPNDSSAYWRQRVRGYDPIYNPKSPYAASVSAGNLLKTTMQQQLPRGVAAAYATNWLSHRLDKVK